MNLNNPEAARLYASMPEHKRTVRITKAFVAKTLRQVRNPYLACSFGKDSAVMLHLVLEQKPDIPVVFVRRIETDLIDNYQEIIDEWKKRFSIHLQILSYKGWLEKDPDGKGIATATWKLDQYDSFFVGLRAQESAARRITIRKNGEIYEMKNGKVRLCPLAWWKTENIAAYIISNELPILNKYKNEGFETRTTAAIPSKFPQESLTSLKQRDIQAFNKLLKLLPEAKYYV